MNSYSMFAALIEASAPTISDGRRRIDQLAKSGHYDLWRSDFERVAELGITFLRWGAAYSPHLCRSRLSH